MLKHIVTFHLHRSEDGQQLKARLLALPAQIDEILHYEAGLHLNADGTEDGSKAVLISHFTDLAALEAYRVHPAHQELISWLRDGRLASIEAVDYHVSES